MREPIANPPPHPARNPKFQNSYHVELKASVTAVAADALFTRFPDAEVVEWALDRQPESHWTPWPGRQHTTDECKSVSGRKAL